MEIFKPFNFSVPIQAFSANNRLEIRRAVLAVPSEIDASLIRNGIKKMEPIAHSPKPDLSPENPSTGVRIVLPSLIFIAGLLLGAAGSIHAGRRGLWTALAGRLGISEASATSTLSADFVMRREQELLRHNHRLESENRLLKESEAVLETTASQLEKRAGDADRLQEELLAASAQRDRLTADLESAGSRVESLIESNLDRLPPTVGKPATKRQARVLQVEPRLGIIAVDRGRAQGVVLGEIYAVSFLDNPDQPPLRLRATVDEVKDHYSLAKVSPARSLPRLKPGAVLFLEED